MTPASAFVSMLTHLEILKSTNHCDAYISEWVVVVSSAMLLSPLFAFLGAWGVLGREGSLSPAPQALVPQFWMRRSWPAGLRCDGGAMVLWRKTPVVCALIYSSFIHTCSKRDCHGQYFSLVKSRRKKKSVGHDLNIRHLTGWVFRRRGG